jgi:hypothetical protein
MALSSSSCLKAISVFETIAPVTNSHPLFRTEENQYDENVVLGIGFKADGGWENLFINVRDITTEQLDIWQTVKKEIPNSSSQREVQPGLTRLYFF